MDVYSFTATKAGVSQNRHALVAGLCNEQTGQYVTFQRDAEQAGEAWGVHFEFNDQINGAYDCIRDCTLSRTSVQIKLVRPIDRQRKISTVEVELAINDSEFRDFVEVLRKVFRNHEKALTIAVGNAND